MKELFAAYSHLEVRHEITRAASCVEGEVMGEGGGSREGGIDGACDGIISLRGVGGREFR